MTNATDYQKEWATLTGRPESDIYIPEALREKSDDNETAGKTSAADRGA